jgi:hypothetical protein
LEAVHRIQKGLLPIRRDDVLNRHQDRSRVGLRVKGQACLWPVDGWFPVEVAGLPHTPEQSSHDSSKHHDGRGEEGQLQSDAFGNQAPDQRSDRHRTSEGDQVDGKAASADPDRQEQLHFGDQG